jgi:flavin-dependent dehydrogenase
VTAPTSSPAYDFDFAVAGGGPAGSSTAISLAQKGHRVVVFERERFPRFHIGESLLSTANEHFAALGVAEQMAAARFPDKWGARLLTHDGQSGRGVDFAHAKVPTPRTYQVSRAEFDRILLDRAAAAGADVRQEHRVSGVDFQADGVVLDVVDAAGQAAKVRVRAMVDATGRAGLLGKKFALRTDEPKLANIAIFSHYTGVPRLPGERPDDIRLIARNDAGWFWVIPISPELMSVGVVIPKARYMTLEHGDPETMLQNAFADTPAIAELMATAQREWPVRVEKDFSYFASRYAGDRWLLAGDAGSFLDPVFSTGVSIAMESGIEAADELDRALRAGNDFRAARFAKYGKRQRRRYEAFRRYVIGFYSPEFRDHFFQQGPVSALYRAVVTVLAGRWELDPITAFLNNLFFFLVRLQRRFALSPRVHRRDAEAGFPPRE